MEYYFHFSQTLISVNWCIVFGVEINFQLVYCKQEMREWSSLIFTHMNIGAWLADKVYSYS